LLQRLLVVGAALSLLFSVAGASPAQALVKGIVPDFETRTTYVNGAARPADPEPTFGAVKKVDTYNVDYSKVAKNEQPETNWAKGIFREVEDGGGGNKTVSIRGLPLYDPTDRK